MKHLKLFLLKKAVKFNNKSAEHMLEVLYYQNAYPNAKERRLLNYHTKRSDFWYAVAQTLARISDLF